MKHRILCFGDSNTYGYDPRSCLGDRYPSSVRWTGLLKAAGWEVINEGQNGRCIPRQAQEAKALSLAVRRSEAKTAVVMLGSNDLLQRPVSSAEACAERMERFLTSLLDEIQTFCEVLLIAPPPVKPGAWVNASGIPEESRRLAACYEALAQRLCIYFADAGSWDIDLTFDGVHFSAAGHRAFAEEIQKTLKQIVTPKG